MKASVVDDVTMTVAISAGVGDNAAAARFVAAGVSGGTADVGNGWTLTVKSADAAVPLEAAASESDPDVIVDVAGNGSAIAAFDARDMLDVADGGKAREAILDEPHAFKPAVQA